MTTTRTNPAGRIPAWSLADRLRKSRESADLTQTQLAERIGVSNRSISTYEGGAPVKRPVVLSWAFATGVSYDWIVDGDEPDGSPFQAGPAKPQTGPQRPRRGSNSGPSAYLGDSSHRRHLVAA